MAYSIYNLFPSFFRTRGPTLIDGADLQQLVQLEFGSASGVTAHAGGTLAAAVPVSGAFIEVDTCATNNDSVILAAQAIPGTSIVINNNGAATLAIYNNQANAQNASAADVIVPHGSTAANASNAALTLASGHATWLICFVLGTWKQIGDFS